MLVMAGEPRALWRSRALPVALPMILFFALFIAIYLRVSKWEHEDTLLEFRLLSQEVVDKIGTGLKEQEVFLEQLERSLQWAGAAVAGRLSPAGSELAAALSDDPGSQMGAANRILAARRPSRPPNRPTCRGLRFARSMRPGQRRRAGERARFLPVTYVEPLKGNEHIVGFDLASEAGRRAAVDATLDTRAVTATPPIRLVQEQGEQVGILLVYAVQEGPNGVGVVSVALRMGTFMTGVLAPVASMIGVRLVDLEPQRVLHSGFSPAAAGVPFSDTFTFGGRRYGVETAPTESYMARAPKLAELGCSCDRRLQHRPAWVRCCSSAPDIRGASRRWWTNARAISAERQPAPRGRDPRAPAG